MRRLTVLGAIVVLLGTVVLTACGGGSDEGDKALFCERLDEALRNRVEPEGAPTIVAFDVMHLSNVNDTFGRHVGDLLLQRVAEQRVHPSLSANQVHCSLMRSKQRLSRLYQSD